MMGENWGIFLLSGLAVKFHQTHPSQQVSKQMSLYYLGCNFVMVLNKENYSTATILIKSWRETYFTISTVLYSHLRKILFNII